MQFTLHHAELLGILHGPRIPLETTSGTAMPFAEPFPNFAGRNPLTLLNGSRRDSLASVTATALKVVRSRLRLASTAPSVVSIGNADLAESADTRGVEASEVNGKNDQMLSIDFRVFSKCNGDVLEVVRMVMIKSVVSWEPRDSLELIRARNSLSSSALSLLLRFILVAALT
jgi:hypothetical protein